MTNIPAATPPITRATTTLRTLDPGTALSVAVAVAAVVSAPLVGRVAPIPAMAIALFIGTALNSVAMRPAFKPGTAIGALGWRHVATVTGTTLVILVIATAGLLVLR